MPTYDEYYRQLLDYYGDVEAIPMAEWNYLNSLGSSGTSKTVAGANALQGHAVVQNSSGLAQPTQTVGSVGGKTSKTSGIGAKIKANMTGFGNGAFSKGGAGWSSMANIASGVDSAISTGHGFDDQGEWGQAANGIFDKGADVLMKIPGCEQYGAALKAADLAGDLSAKFGLTNDGQTGIDQISQNGVGNLVIGTLMGNNLFTRKTSKFGADEETLENVGGSYGGTANDIYAAADKADKTYGWMSSHNRKKAQRAIDTARQQQNQLAAISKQNEQMHQMVDMMGGVAADAYRTQLSGGYDQSAMRVERGGRLEGKDYIEEEPVVYEVEDPTGPAVVEIVIEQYSPDVPCPEMEMPDPYCVEQLPGDVSEGVLGARFPCGRTHCLDNMGHEKAERVMREVADVRDDVVEDFRPEMLDRVIPEVYNDFGQVAEAVGGEGLKERVVEEFVPEIVDRVVPEVLEMSGEAAERGAFEMKRRLVGRMTGRDIAGLFGAGTGGGEAAGVGMPVSGKVGDELLGMFLSDVFGGEADGPSCPVGMPDMLGCFLEWVAEDPMRTMGRGGGTGFSYSAGSSSSSVTRDMPGVGPVTVTRRSVMRPQVNVWAKGGKAVERQLDAPEIEESLQKNLIPEGALHKQRHHMDMGDDVTKKGIPVMDIKEDNGQEAEIERNEIIFNKEVTEKLEELYAVYYDGQSTEEEKDQAAIDAGKLLTREIMLNTDDRTGLIDTLKRGGKMQDGGRAKYTGRSLEELVAYAREKNPRFVQRLDEFPMIVDVGDGRYGSHLLAYATDSDENPTKAWIYPEVMEIEDGDGLRVYTGEDAMREAQRRGDWLEVTPDEAAYFTERYKEAWPDYMKSFDEMEKYMMAHPDADPVMVRKMFMARYKNK